MALTIRFPLHGPAKVHYRYLRNAFAHAGCRVIDAPVRRMTWPDFTVSSKPGQDQLSFEFRFGGRRVIVDYGNHSAVRFRRKHLKYQCHAAGGPAVPITKVSFLDWPRAEALWKEVRYRAAGDIVLCNWRMKRPARIEVAGLLRAHLDGRADFEFTDQEIWWRKFSECLAYIQVPGYCNHILDRGQIQAMAFGVCTISPAIPDLLAYARPLEPGRHYLRCADDYSDLLDLIAWCDGHRGQCREIGEEARRLFIETSTPARLVEWIESTMP